MKILLIAGHGGGSGTNYTDPGACSSYGIEAKQTRRVANKLQQLLKPYMEVVMYPQSHNAYADVCNGTFAVGLSGINYVFEIHFNSASANARGTEVWVTPQESSTSVERKIVNNLASCGFVNRGVKKEQFAVILHCKNRGVSSALVETCFISNKADMDTYNAKFNQVCEAMAKGIVEGFGMTYKTQEATKVDTSNKIEYKAMVQDVGWQPVKSDGQTAGTTGQKKRLEALWIKYTGKGKLTFSSHIQNIGWTTDRTSGEITGTVDMAYRMEAIRIKLEGSNKKIQYRVHIEDIGWTKWCSNNEVAGTIGQSKRIEAIEIRLI